MKKAVKKVVYRRADWKEKIRKETKAYKQRRKREMEALFLPYLRDMFAGQALQGMVLDSTVSGEVTDADGRRAALSTEAYRLADAMMAARKAKPKA